jgi:hypothetical protein
VQAPPEAADEDPPIPNVENLRSTFLLPHLRQATSAFPLIGTRASVISPHS